MRAFCDNCPYSIELQVFGGLEPHTVSNDGSSNDGTLGRVLVTFHDLQYEPETNADNSTITIETHNESAKTVSGSFSFSTTINGQNYDGTGTFTNAFYN